MSTATKSTDPIASVADSLEEASEHFEFAEALETELSPTVEILEKTAYSTFYYFSYGVCFAGYLAAKLIPKEGLIAQGLHDGADAARDAVDRIATAHEDEYSDFDEPAPQPAKVAKAPAPKKASTAKKTSTSGKSKSAAAKSTASKSATPKTSTAKSTAKSTKSA